QILTEVMIAPRSRLIGSSLRFLDRRWPYNATVLAVHRRGEVLRRQLKDLRLDVGDVLLMLVPESDMQGLRADSNVIVLSQRDAEKAMGWRAPFALVTMALVIGIAAVGWAPISVTALAGAVAMTLAGCLEADEVYDAVDWRVIILLAGVLPLGIAMSQSGAAQLVVANTLGVVSSLGPLVVL